jgi:hypothetical protein
MMIHPLTHMVILAQAGMILMNLQDHMAAKVAIMMMILMLVHSAVHVVVDQLVAVLQILKKL